MERVKRAVYIDGEDEIPASDNPQTYKLDALEIVFACPICETTQHHQTEPSPGSDEEYLCTSCDNTYFLFPLSDKDGTKESVTTRVEEQLESVAILHNIAEREPNRLRKVTFAVPYFITGAIPIFFGLLVNISLAIMLFSTVGFTVATFVVVTNIALQSGVGVMVTGTGVLRFTYNWIRYYREVDSDDTTFFDLLGHVGNYCHKDPYSFET